MPLYVNLINAYGPEQEPCFFHPPHGPSLSPESLTFWRSLVNTIALIPALYVVKGPKRMGREALVFTILGALFLSGYMYLFFMGLSVGYAGALVTTTVPLITFALSAVIFRHGVSRKDALGLALGVVGGAVLLGAWTLDAGRIFIGGNAYFLVAALLWALLTLSSQKACGMISPILFSLWRMRSRPSFSSFWPYRTA